MGPDKSTKVSKTKTTGPRKRTGGLSFGPDSAAASVSPTAMPSSPSIPGQARSGFGSPSSTPTPKLYSGAPPAAAARGVPSTPPVYAGDAVAASFRKGQAIGARKVAAKAAKPKMDRALKTSSPPKARPAAAAKKTGLAGLLAGNKGNNEAKALERMKKSGRKG